MQFETFRRFADHAEAAGLEANALWTDEAKALRGAVAKEVLDGIKQGHETDPKYDFHEASQADIVAEHSVEEVRLAAR